MNDKIYLGDSVYAEYHGPNSDVVLTTNNGYPDDPRNTIYISVSMLEDLINFVDTLDNS